MPETGPCRREQLSGLRSGTIAVGGIVHDETDLDSSAGCPILSMVRVSYGCIISDGPFRALPFDRS